MLINPISVQIPAQNFAAHNSFKGFIYSPDDKAAVNTKHITAMTEEKSFDEQAKTKIFSTDRTSKTMSVPLEQVLQAYSRASASETYYVNVKNYGTK